MWVPVRERGHVAHVHTHDQTKATRQLWPPRLMLGFRKTQSPTPQTGFSLRDLKFPLEYPPIRRRRGTIFLRTMRSAALLVSQRGPCMYESYSNDILHRLLEVNAKSPGHSTGS